MNDGVGLRHLYAQLDPPGDSKASGEGLSFSAVAVPGRASLHVGRSGRGASLLVETSDGLPRPRITLKNLDVLYDAQCSILSSSGARREGTFTVITCTAEAPELRSVFFDVLTPLVLGAAQPLESTAINDMIRALVEVFRSAAERPKSSLIGVWGELFLIAYSSDPVSACLSWHVQPADVFDFAQDGQRVEVKTSSGARRHRFALEQLLPPNGTELVIASVLARSSAAGATILDLYRRIAERLPNQVLVADVVRKIAGALGEDISTWGTVSYDPSAAAESLRFVRGDALPKFSVPASISRVRFDLDFDKLGSLELAPGVGLVDVLTPRI